MASSQHEAPASYTPQVPIELLCCCARWEQATDSAWARPRISVASNVWDMGCRWGDRPIAEPSSEYPSAAAWAARSTSWDSGRYSRPVGTVLPARSCFAPVPVGEFGRFRL